MSSYRRVLSVIEPLEGAAHVIRRAALLARMCGATLAVASVADHPPGGNDSIRERLSFVTDATRRVERLAGSAGVRDLEVLVSERDCHALSALVGSWHPDLIVVGAREPRGLAGWTELLRESGADHAADVLKVEPEHTGVRRRVATVLAGLF